VLLVSYHCVGQVQAHLLCSWTDLLGGAGAPVDFLAVCFALFMPKLFCRSSNTLLHVRTLVCFLCSTAAAVPASLPGRLQDCEKEMRDSGDSLFPY
jgi:hypothetical protein